MKRAERNVQCSVRIQIVETTNRLSASLQGICVNRSHTSNHRARCAHRLPRGLCLYGSLRRRGRLSAACRAGAPPELHRLPSPADVDISRGQENARATRARPIVLPHKSLALSDVVLGHHGARRSSSQPPSSLALRETVKEASRHCLLCVYIYMYSTQGSDRRAPSSPRRGPPASSPPATRPAWRLPPGRPPRPRR